MIHPVPTLTLVGLALACLAHSCTAEDSIWTERIIPVTQQDTGVPLQSEALIRSLRHINSTEAKAFLNWYNDSPRFMRPSSTNHPRGVLHMGFDTADNVLGLKPESNPSPFDPRLLTFVLAQGGRAPFYHRGLPLYKFIWDYAVMPQLLLELRPRTVIEVGSGSGSSALWMADTLGAASSVTLDYHVHSYDISPPKGASHPNVSFHYANARMPLKSWPKSKLQQMPHPWFVVVDSVDPHEFEAMLENFLEEMVEGDYFYIEDVFSCSPAPGKPGQVLRYDDARAKWLRFFFKHGHELALDTKYTDFFGVNLISAADAIARVTRSNADPKDPPGSPIKIAEIQSTSPEQKEL